MGKPATSPEPPSPEPPSAIELLESLDLEGIRNEIEKLEAERDEMISRRQRRIDALRILERAADVRENGNPKRAPRKKSAKKKTAAVPDSFEAVADRVAIYLGAVGPQKPDTIAAECKIPAGTVDNILGDDRFRRMTDGKIGLPGQR